jgi:hypothetical protein
MMAPMKSAIFVEPGRIVLDEKPVPDVGPLDAWWCRLQFRVAAAALRTAVMQDDPDLDRCREI